MLLLGTQHDGRSKVLTGAANSYRHLVDDETEVVGRTNKLNYVAGFSIQNIQTEIVLSG